MTKRDNKRINVRRARRVLNRAIDFLTQVTGRRLNRHGYSAGLSRSEVRERAVDSSGDSR